ncbi:MAG TPA: MarR family transcriptional regulator [Trebonia sp.]
MTAADSYAGASLAPAGPRIEDRLATLTGYLAQLAAARAEQLARAAFPPGRDMRDLAVLSVLAEGPVSQARLGDLVGVNRTVMITVVGRLEEAGLVLRERDPADRRRYALAITSDGRTLLAAMLTAARQADSALLAPLSAAQRQRLENALLQLLPDLTGTLPGSLTSLAGFLLGRASRLLRGQREDAMRSLGLEPRCVRMLVPLDSAQPCTQEQLARRMDLTSPTIVQSVDELHDSGLITRDRNPGDRREHVLRLTGDGRDYLTRALTAEDSAQDLLAARLGAGEITDLNESLTLIVNAR